MATSLRTPHQAERYVRSNPTTMHTNAVASGFSPHEAHAHQAFFGWILPTIRTSEFTVLQIVGLDAAVVCGLFVASISAKYDAAPSTVPQLPQDVLLALRVMLGACCRDSDAYKPQGEPLP